MRYIAIVALALLCACASYKRTLTDERGRSVTCEASGKSGVLESASS